MKQAIITCLTWQANMVAQTVQYDTWSDEFCRRMTKDVYNSFINELKKHIDLKHITREEAVELGFTMWSHETPDLYLIPLYLLPIIPVGTKLTSISGDKVIYDGTNIDKDILFGCLAYGIKIDEYTNNADVE